MTFFRTKIFIAAVSFMALPLYCLAIKSNDFTRASAIGARRYQSDKSELSGKSSSLGDKKFDSKNYRDASKKSNLSGEVSRWNGENSTFESSQRADGASKRFGVPEYKGKKDSWDMGNKKSKFSSPDKNFTKKYRGRIDVDKRNSDYQGFIDEYYGNLVERSMEDINKYYSRTSSSSRADSIRKAGGNLSGEGDDGFFDFLSSDETVRRKAVSFKGVEKVFRPNKMSDSSSEKKSENTSANLESSASLQPKLSTITGTKTETTRLKSDVKEEIIDLERAKNLRFLNVPNEFRSKASIKVKVKE